MPQTPIEIRTTLDSIIRLFRIPLRVITVILLGLAALPVEAEPNSGGIMPPTESAPGAYTSIGSYRYHADVKVCDCVLMCQTAFNGRVIIERNGETYRIVNPFVDPEEIGIPILYEGRISEGRLVMGQDDVFTINYLGNLHVVSRLEMNAVPTDEGFKGRLHIEAYSQPVGEVDPVLYEQVRTRYSVPCRVEAEMTGEPIPALEMDVEKAIRLWGLLKQDVDNTMTRRPDQSFQPLDEGGAIPGDHHARFLWRKARACYLAGENLPTDAAEERRKLFESGIEAARKALELDPQLGEASFFLSANLGRRNTTIGRLKTFFGLEEFEAGCLKTIDNNASDNLFGFKCIGDAHYALGQFYRLVPDSWLVETLLGTRGSLDKSIAHLREAVAIQPQRGDYRKELGVSLLCKGQEASDEKLMAEGRDWLTKALDTTVYANHPERDYEHIRELLAQPEKACKYSRDQY